MRGKTFDYMARFIHAADIHLGHGQFDKNERSQDFLDGFEYILNSAKAKRAEFILLCGDVFDSLELIPHIYEKTLGLIDKFKSETNNSIPIIAIEGNHDCRNFALGARYEESSSWLKILAKTNHLILLSTPDFEETEQIIEEYDTNTKSGNFYVLNDTEIIGLTYSGEEPMDKINRLIFELKKKPTSKFRILMAHMGIRGQLPDIPNIPAPSYANIEDLRKYIDYLALGHFHLKFQLENWVFNPGASETVNISERDFKSGIFYVETKKIEEQESDTKKTEDESQQNNETIIQNDDINQDSSENGIFKPRYKNIVTFLEPKQRPMIYLEQDARILEDMDKLIRICNIRVGRYISEKKPMLYIKFRNTASLNKMKSKMTYLDNKRKQLINECGLFDAEFNIKPTKNTVDEYIPTLTDYISFRSLYDELDDEDS